MELKKREELDKELKELKQKYNRVYEISAPLTDDDDCDFVTIFIKNIDRDTLSAFRKIALNSNDSLKSLEVILRNLWVGGDKVDILINSDEAMMSTEPVIYQVINKSRGSLKKN
jgi:hypothetical protein